MSEDDLAPATSNDSTEDLILSPGVQQPANTGPQLFRQLNDLKAATDEVSSDLCTLLSHTAISTITADEIKKSSQIQKKHLADYLLSLLQQCRIVCQSTNMDHIASPSADVQSNAIIAKVAASVHKTFNSFNDVQNKRFKAMTEAQDERFKAIQQQISQLNLHSDSLATHSNGNLDDVGDLQPALTNEVLPNPTKCIDTYVPDFIPNELSETLTSFLDQCEELNTNKERGHTVVLYGYPYHYTNAKHSGTATDIPEPIQKLIAIIKEKYPDQEAPNSCLVNKYSGPTALLPRHSDNERTLDPESHVFTASLGKPVTVRFTELVGNSPTVEKVIEPNSLYTMSRKSQNYWSHEIPENSLSQGEVRYSVTLRHVSEKFVRSTIVIGDSNTRHLRFGEGKGTFGHLIPGQRKQATHISDIEPSDCCGYTNIFIHCGINDVKHYRVNSPDKVAQCFEKLKSKIDEISILCPKSRLFISPILPTKNSVWNARAADFNRLLFKYKATSGKFSNLSFGGFVDNSTGLLREDMGRYNSPGDVLHLGSHGIRTLVALIREQVYSSKISSSRLFSSVVEGNTAAADGRRSRGAPWPHRTSRGAS